MLGLRYYACRTCGTVYADITEPPACDDDRCPGGRFDDVTERLLEDAYFTRGVDGR